MLYYSKTTNGFYHSDFGYATLPADVVEISEETHQAMMEGQAAGRVIDADADGRPMLRNRVTTPEELQAQRALAASILLGKTDIDVLRYYEDEMPVPAALKQYRADLRRVLRGELGVLPTAPTW